MRITLCIRIYMGLYISQCFCVMFILHNYVQQSTNRIINDEFLIDVLLLVVLHFSCIECYFSIRTIGTSPFVTDHLPRGSHRVIIVPVGCGRKRKSASVRFNVEQLSIIMCNTQCCIDMCVVLLHQYGVCQSLYSCCTSFFNPFHRTTFQFHSLHHIFTESIIIIAAVHVQYNLVLHVCESCVCTQLFVLLESYSHHT